MRNYRVMSLLQVVNNVYGNTVNNGNQNVAQVLIFKKNGFI
jgi:hypothetical protein